MTKYIFTAILALFFLASCMSPEKIHEKIVIKDFVGYTEFGEDGKTIMLDVDYGLGKNLCLKDGKLTVRDGNRTFAKITAQDVLVRKNSAGVVELPMEITMNSLAAVSALFSKPKVADMTVSGSVKVRYGGLGKKLKLKDVPVPDVLEVLGIEEEAFLNMFE